jgi:hypothetical protein
MINNFLTLFLSIKATKAILEGTKARAINNFSGYYYAWCKVGHFTKQLNGLNHSWPRYQMQWWGRKPQEKAFCGMPPESGWGEGGEEAGWDNWEVEAGCGAGTTCKVLCQQKAHGVQHEVSKADEGTQGKLIENTSYFGVGVYNLEHHKWKIWC